MWKKSYLWGKNGRKEKNLIVFENALNSVYSTSLAFAERVNNTRGNC